jgi:RecJ-like exonuclease
MSEKTIVENKPEKKAKKKEKAVAPWSHNIDKILEQPSEIDCPNCQKSGWVTEGKCPKCEGYGAIELSMTQRMQLFYGDCYIDKEKGELVYRIN